MQNPLQNLFVWDNHACLPLRWDDDRFLPELLKLNELGVDVVSINISFDHVPVAAGFRLASHFRAFVDQHPEQLCMVSDAKALEAASTAGKTTVCFDIEGANAIDGQLSLIHTYYELGVRWMLIAYNQNNLAGGGCQDEDCGLTQFGRDMLREMRRVGMVSCCSHTGYRTAMQVMEIAEGPVIFSHSNPTSLHEHKRNIPDELIDACAQTGGVIGINGIGLFLADNKASPELVAQHLDYVAQRVGADHVGIGLDYCFDQQEVADFVAANPDVFPPEEGYERGLAMLAPDALPAVADELSAKGYSHADLDKIFGRNFQRVAQAVWR